MPTGGVGHDSNDRPAGEWPATEPEKSRAARPVPPSLIQGTLLAAVRFNTVHCGAFKDDPRFAQRTHASSDHALAPAECCRLG